MLAGSYASSHQVTEPCPRCDPRALVFDTIRRVRRKSATHSNDVGIGLDTGVVEHGHDWTKLNTAGTHSVNPATERKSVDVGEVHRLPVRIMDAESEHRVGARPRLATSLDHEASGRLATAGCMPGQGALAVGAEWSAPRSLCARSRPRADASWLSCTGLPRNASAPHCRQCS